MQLSAGFDFFNLVLHKYQPIYIDTFEKLGVQHGLVEDLAVCLKGKSGDIVNSLSGK